MWGRQCYRWSDLDFEANAKEGVAVDWPIRYKDIAPWYSYVEKFVGISGSKEGIPHLPDGEFLPPMEMNCLEEHIATQLRGKNAGRQMIIGRVANLTRGWNGRGPCQFRNMCDRGCRHKLYDRKNCAIPAGLRAVHIADGHCLSGHPDRHGACGSSMSTHRQTGSSRHTRYRYTRNARQPEG